MEYISKFLEAMIFAGELEPELKIGQEQLAHLEKYYNEQSKNKEIKVIINKELSRYANNYIKNAPFGLANQCHNICQSFFDLCTRNGVTEICGMAITIGNVRYKGKKLYKTTPESIKETIRKGFQPEEQLDLHVWLTLVDMSVLDLTIIPTLISKNKATPKDFKGKELVLWRKSNDHHLEYIPMLHDDNFLHKVDKLAFRV